MPTPRKIRFKGAAYVLAEDAAPDPMQVTMADYLSKIEKAFLEVASTRVREVAMASGLIFERIEVREGRPGGVVWLEYVGQDRGDNDMAFIASVSIRSPSKVLVQWETSHAMRGKQAGSIDKPAGQMTPQVVVDAFRAQV